MSTEIAKFVTPGEIQKYVGEVTEQKEEIKSFSVWMDKQVKITITGHYLGYVQAVGDLAHLLCCSDTIGSKKLVVSFSIE